LGSEGTGIDSTLSEGDSEESALSPSGVPRVSADPVLDSVLLSPSDELDGVSSEEVTLEVLVDSALVGHEILIDVETSLDGSVGEDFELDGLRVGVLARRSLLDEVLGGGLSILALLELTAVRLVSLDALVGPARFSDKTVSFHELPGEGEHTSLASEIVVVARDHILSTEDSVDGSLGGDAESVRGSLSGTKSPAGSAVSLVSNGVDAIRPLLSSIEALRNVRVLRDSLVLNNTLRDLNGE
jgi:hypothetical protein